MRIGSAVAAMVLVGACGSSPADPVPAPAPALPAPQPHATLAQMMRGIPFPASNIIFDTQSEDPGVPKKAGDTARGATASFSSVYGGWQAVENNALAIAETANLLIVPGRVCENGRPVPLDREDFRKFAAGLVDAGNAAYKAAQSKNLDAMVEVSGTVSDACAACHEVYRDKDDPKARCIP
ncbi:MAG TPA: cytochrome c [Vicinamibacterales bacterium]|nr:cytochrome c [Vicinamibacterales bacterium]